MKSLCAVVLIACAPQLWAQVGPAATQTTEADETVLTTGTTTYEPALLKQPLGYRGKGYEANPGAQRNVFNRLRRAAKDSKLVGKQAEQLSADEKREILRALFEGHDTSSKVLGPETAQITATTRFNGLYDRLSVKNLRGYSPELMSLQSALNARRPPGAPALVETGKLDYATLSYPAYAMSYDIDNFELRLRRERSMALARLAGKTFSRKDSSDTALESRLLVSNSACVPKRLRDRARFIEKARSSLAEFKKVSDRSKNPSAISHSFLVELGTKQKETARWITAASLEENLSWIEGLENFLTPELLAAIASAPVPLAERENYRRRGEALQARISRVKENAEKALALLESDAWSRDLAEEDKLVSENQAAKQALARDIADYCRTPFGVSSAFVHQPAWRDWLDNLAVRWAPSLEYSRAVAARRKRLSFYLNVFGLIASGDATAAHAALASIPNL